MSHLEDPSGIAELHDQKRARAEDLRKQAATLDAEADALALRHDEMVASAKDRVNDYLDAKRA